MTGDRQQDVTFRAVVEASGKTATGIEVPAEALDALGRGRRPAVRVTLNGYTYRSTVGAMGGRAMLPLSAEHRTASGLAAGDHVEVTLAADDEPRVVDVPPDLAAALDAEPEAGRRFAALSYSQQRQQVLAVEGAKTEATRQRRVAKVVEQLLGE